MSYGPIFCHRCGGRMMPSIKVISNDDSRPVIEVIWTCNKCGNWKAAIIGAG